MYVQLIFDNHIIYNFLPWQQLINFKSAVNGLKKTIFKKIVLLIIEIFRKKILLGEVLKDLFISILLIIITTTVE